MDPTLECNVLYPLAVGVVLYLSFKLFEARTKRSYLAYFSSCMAFLFSFPTHLVCSENAGDI